MQLGLWGSLGPRRPFSMSTLAELHGGPDNSLSQEAEAYTTPSHPGMVAEVPRVPSVVQESAPPSLRGRRPWEVIPAPPEKASLWGAAPSPPPHPCLQCLGQGHTGGHSGSYLEAGDGQCLQSEAWISYP